MSGDPIFPAQNVIRVFHSNGIIIVNETLTMRMHKIQKMLPFTESADEPLLPRSRRFFAAGIGFREQGWREPSENRQLEEVKNTHE